MQYLRIGRSPFRRESAKEALKRATAENRSNRSEMRGFSQPRIEIGFGHPSLQAIIHRDVGTRPNRPPSDHDPTNT